MTIKNVVAKLDQTKMDYRLTSIALSRVTKFKHIGLIDSISMSKLHKAIAYQSKMERRIKEEDRFKMLCSNTLRYYS